MLGKQAKILSVQRCQRPPGFCRVLPPSDPQPGDRVCLPKPACAQARSRSLTWDMVVDAGGKIGNVIELRDHAAKKGGGRLIPMHPELADALSAWRQASTRSSADTGGSMPADIARGPGRVPSPGTSMLAPCPATRCGTATSTRWRTACSCSCGTLPMTISWAGLIGNWVRWIPNLWIDCLPSRGHHRAVAQRLWGGR